MTKQVPKAQAGSITAIALVCGGTAGHVYPALAVAEAFRERYARIDVLFIGAKKGHGFERALIASQGESLALVTARPWVKTGPLGKLGALASLPWGIGQARSLLKQRGSQFVLGFGGYATPSVLLAAKSLGLATAVHEANALPGRANRLLGHLVDRVYLASKAAEATFPTDKTVLVGYPLQPKVRALSQRPKEPPALDQRAARVLIIGGSLGAGFLNARCPELMAGIAARGMAVAVRHQSGVGREDAQRQAYAQANIKAEVESYIHDISQAYDWADFVISAGGFGSLAEIAAIGLPALLVPTADVADDHQSANVADFVALSGAWRQDEADWQPADLAEKIAALLADQGAWRAASAAMRLAAAPDAANALVADAETWLAPPDR
ncbi:MAG: UDP-N-acetylglucosamine--N-acetylmuramyl-(pentapeptide) pyrophosphoryl-undecaprenol N-acetylglucosamine transferase [Pseudomonadota bacterium]